MMMIRPDFFHFLFLFLEIDNNDGGRSDQISSTFCSHFSSTPSTPANQGRRPQGEYLLCFLFCCLSLQYLHNGSEIIQDGYFFSYQSHSSYFQLGLKHSLCLERRSPLKKVIYKSSLFSVHSPSASILIEAVRPLVTYTPSSAPYSALQIIFGVRDKM